MSIQAVAWVLEHSEATLADRLVLIAIANHADARGWNAWPAVESIAREARVGRTTVYRSIESLEQAGELAIHHRPGKSNIYGIAALMGSQPGTGEGSQIGTVGVPNTRKRGPKLGPKPSVTVQEPARANKNVTVGFPDRCHDCGYLAFDCHCGQIVDKDRAKQWVQALRRGEQPA